MIRPLFLGFALYLVVPVWEIPLFGLSWSAPLLALLALELGLGDHDRLLRNVRLRWVLLAAAFWFGCALSWTASSLGVEFSTSGAAPALLLLRFLYWTAAFVLVATAFTSEKLAASAARALAVGVTVLAVLRLAEGALTGVWGGGNPAWLSQNDYGFGFSAFFPYVAAASLRSRWAWPALLLAAAAAAGNGSRSSWIAVAVGLAVLALVHLLADGRRAARFAAPAAAVALLAVAVGLSPAGRPIRDRLATFERLDSDKPFQTRGALVRKGLQLFEQHPWTGAGLGRFTVSYAPLHAPDRTPWLDEADLNRRSAHNAYVQTLAETGLAGVVPFTLLLVALFLGGAPAAVRLTRAGRPWAAPAYASLCGASIHLVTLSGLTGTAPWFVFGAVAGLIDQDRPRRREDPR